MENLIPIKGGKLPFHQTKTYGCGSYSLANLFNRSCYLDNIEDGGESQFMLNEKLEKHKENGMFLQTLVLTSPRLEYSRIKDKTLFDCHDMPNGYFSPYLMISYHPGTNVFHYSAICHLYEKDLFFVMDSRKTEIQIFTREQLFEVFWIVGIEYFNSRGANANDEVILMTEEFEHIFKTGL